MDTLTDYILKYQTVFGCIRFYVFLLCWPAVILSLNGRLNSDRLEFKCIPKPDDVTLLRCYDDYTSTISPLLTPLTFSTVTSSAIGFLWLLIIVYSAKVLPQIKGQKNDDKKKRQIDSFWWKFFIHVCVELAVLFAMFVVFLCYQTINIRGIYMCPRRNATVQMPFSQVVNLECRDQHHWHKSVLNRGIILIILVSMILCGITIIRSLRRTKRLLIDDLVNLESESSESDSRLWNYQGNVPKVPQCQDEVLRLATEKVPKSPDELQPLANKVNGAQWRKLGTEKVPKSHDELQPLANKVNGAQWRKLGISKKGSPSHEELQWLSSKVKDDWRALALILNLHTYVIDAIDKDFDEYHKKVESVLDCWIAENGSVATYEALQNALRRLGRRDLAEDFLETAG